MFCCHLSSQDLTPATRVTKSDVLTRGAGQGRGQTDQHESSSRRKIGGRKGSLQVGSQVRSHQRFCVLFRFHAYPPAWYFSHSKSYGGDHMNDQKRLEDLSSTYMHLFKPVKTIWLQHSLSILSVLPWPLLLTVLFPIQNINETLNLRTSLNA